MTMGMWNDENGEKCLTKNIYSREAQSPATTPNGSSVFVPASNKVGAGQAALPSSDKPD